jgi:DNA-nicking Smr family endonuclease
MAKKRKTKPKKKKEFKNQPLAGLAQLKKQSKASPKPKDNKPVLNKEQPLEVTDDEESLFLAAMSGTDPLSGRTSAIPPPPQIKPSATPEEQETQEVLQTLQDLVDGEINFSIHQTDEAIEGMVSNLDWRILRKLRRGEYAVQGHLDLHGYTRDEAREKVKTFIQQSMAERKRCILIIHGRGHGSKDRDPVLKKSLTSWFTRRSLRKKILAFTTARPCDGGAGAVYVLLRKPKPLGER